MDGATVVAEDERGVRTADEHGAATIATEEPAASEMDDAAIPPEDDAVARGPMGRMRAAVASRMERSKEGVRGTIGFWAGATKLSWEQAGWKGRTAIAVVGAVIAAGAIASMSAGALLIAGVAAAGVTAGLVVNETHGGGALSATGRWLRRDFTPQRRSEQNAAHEAPDVSPEVGTHEPAAPTLERDSLTGRLTKESLSFVRQQQYWRIEGREARGYRDAMAGITQAGSMEEASALAVRALETASDSRLGRGLENRSYRWALEQISDPTKSFVSGIGDARVLAAEAVSMYGADSVALTNARPARSVGSAAAVNMKATPTPRMAVPAPEAAAPRGAAGVAMAAGASRPARQRAAAGPSEGIGG